MKKLLTIFLICCSLNGFGQNDSSKVFIPPNINECMSQLDSILVDSVKSEFKNFSYFSVASKCHTGLGEYMRNRWGLWHKSVLAEYFRDMGVRYADDMSTIILNSYHRYLNGKEIQLDEQLKSYKLEKPRKLHIREE